MVPFSRVRELLPSQSVGRAGLGLGSWHCFCRRPCVPAVETQPWPWFLSLPVFLSLHVPVHPCSEQGSSVSSVSAASTAAISGGGMVCFYLISNFIIIKSIFTNIHFP